MNSGAPCLLPRIPVAWQWRRHIPARPANDAGGQGRVPTPARSAGRTPGAGLRGVSSFSSSWIMQLRLEQVHVDHVVAHTVTDDGLAETAELPETNLAVGLVATRIYGQMPQEDAVQVQLVEPV